jgi:hypothetical protein
MIWEVSLGSIINALSIFFVGAGFYWKQVYDSRSFKLDIAEIKLDLKVLNKVMIDLALQNQRLDNQGERLNSIDRHIDEIRHGQGLVK